MKQPLLEIIEKYHGATSANGRLVKEIEELYSKHGAGSTLCIDCKKYTENGKVSDCHV